MLFWIGDKLMIIPFLGGSYTARSPDINAQRSVNLYPVIDQQEGKTVVAMYGTPGLKTYGDSGDGAEVRALTTLAGTLYAVIGNTLYSVTENGATFTSIGTLSTSSGRVFTNDNATYLMLLDNSGNGYTYDGTTFAAISDTDFPTASSLTFQDGRFIVTENNTGNFYESDLDDPTSWDATRYGNAEGDSDYLVSCLSSNREIWLFGEKTTEVYYNSGDADFSWARVPGVFIEYGCIAKHSVVKQNGITLWLSDNKQVIAAEGYTPKVISTRQVDYQISTYSTVSDATAYSYTQEGHAFYVLNFPTADKTWVFDISTGYWHERTSYPSEGRHRGNCFVNFGDKKLVGDYENGIIYEYDLNTYTENSKPIRRIRTAQVIDEDRAYIFFHRLEVEFEAGVGLKSGQGNDPQVSLDWSDDGGHTWSNEHLADMGKIGEYTRRTIWRRLGKSRGRNFRLTITDPVKVVIIQAYLKANKGL